MRGPTGVDFRKPVHASYFISYVTLSTTATRKMSSTGKKAWLGPETYFTKVREIIIQNVCCSYLANICLISSQLCTCHDSWVVTCANLWPDRIIKIIITAMIIFTKFQLWTHESCVKWVPVLQRLFKYLFLYICILHIYTHLARTEVEAETTPNSWKASYHHSYKFIYQLPLPGQGHRAMINQMNKITEVHR